MKIADDIFERELSETDAHMINQELKKLEGYDEVGSGNDVVAGDTVPMITVSSPSVDPDVPIDTKITFVLSRIRTESSIQDLWVELAEPQEET